MTPDQAKVLCEATKQITAQPWRPFSAGYTYSYELQGWPGLRLMEGKAVAHHSDNVEYIRPILWLYNPGYKLLQHGKPPVVPKPGDITLLDINQEHAVVDGNGYWDAWAAITIEEKTDDPVEVFKEFVEAMLCSEKR